MNDDPSQPAGQSMNFTERRPTYAEGDVIHFGSESLQLGDDELTTFVQTDAGFVYVTADGTVKVADGRRTTKIGTGDTTQRLTVDDAGTLVGWVDSSAKRPEFVVYDVAARREIVRTAEGTANAPEDKAPRVSAIDDGFAYFSTGTTIYRWHLATGTGTVIDSQAGPDKLHSVDAGRFTWEVHRASDDMSQIAVGTDLRRPPAKVYPGWDTNVSPDARYLMTDMADEVRLFDLRTGNQLPLKFPGYILIVPTQWQGDAAFYAVGFKKSTDERLDLLRCSTSTLTCQVVSAGFAPTPVDLPEFQLPVGFVLD
ncbi:hypothetical protein BWI15_09945 [Kribbella sp. ALI-6-A]|uniref:hypothetical protein n=1 Tax=Kribbella sp. ALI-6-A TaxID=1933817 RepID=UPI00097C2781|nr:hypothetical protein [Kribbella sp. ALI-6-A]ONI73738.1 hypothetical protein BWI15_09945 [Kribbella sp. ALI-6-A]